MLSYMVRLQAVQSVANIYFAHMWESINEFPRAVSTSQTRCLRAVVHGYCGSEVIYNSSRRDVENLLKLTDRLLSAFIPVDKQLPFRLEEWQALAQVKRLLYKDTSILTQPFPGTFLHLHTLAYSQSQHVCTYNRAAYACMRACKHTCTVTQGDVIVFPVHVCTNLTSLRPKVAMHVLSM